MSRTPAVVGLVVFVKLIAINGRCQLMNSDYSLLYGIYMYSCFPPTIKQEIEMKQKYCTASHPNTGPKIVAQANFKSLVLIGSTRLDGTGCIRFSVGRLASAGNSNIRGSSSTPAKRNSLAEHLDRVSES
jgi:hypothetical protein